MSSFDEYLKHLRINITTDAAGVKTGRIFNDSQISEIATHVFWTYKKFVSNISTYKISTERFMTEIDGVKYIFVKNIE